MPRLKYVRNGGRLGSNSRFAYQQVELDEENQELLVLNTHQGLLRYKRLNFGVAFAPAIFQSKVHSFLLGDLNVNFKNRTSSAFTKVNFFAQSNGLCQYIKKTPREILIRPDLCWTLPSRIRTVGTSGTLEHFISDHQPVFFIHKKGRDKRDSE